jgi:hypothetical protein
MGYELNRLVCYYCTLGERVFVKPFDQQLMFRPKFPAVFLCQLRAAHGANVEQRAERQRDYAPESVFGKDAQADPIVANAPTKGTFARLVFLRSGLGVSSRRRLSNFGGPSLRLC